MYVQPKTKFVDQTQRRWNRVLLLANRCEAPDSDGSYVPHPPRDDQYVVTAFRFLREMREAGDDEQAQRQVSLRYPTLYEAYTLKIVATRRVQDAVESMLLTGLPLDEISEQTGATVAALEWYQKLWYDTGDEPMTSTRALATYVPQAGTNGFSTDDVGSYWKLAGTCWGPDMLRLLVSGEVLDDEKLKRLQMVARSEMSRKALRSVMSMPVNSFTGQGLIDSHLMMEKNLSDIALAHVGSDKQVSDFVKLFMSGMAFSALESGNIPLFMHNPSPNFVSSVTVEEAPALPAPGDSDERSPQ